MSDANRAMFWRIIRRLLGANRGRLFVMLLALGAGAAVTAALLNLQVDAKRRITTEFRAFGANVVIGPRDYGGSSKTLNASLFARIPDTYSSGQIAKAAFLYGIIEVSAQNRTNDASASSTRAVVTGFYHSENRPSQVLPPRLYEAEQNWKFVSSTRCAVGQKLASTLKLAQYDGILLSDGQPKYSCAVSLLPPSGGPEDSQIFINLNDVQWMLGQPGRISLIQLSVPGTSDQIQEFISGLQPDLGDAEGRPVRQFTEAQAKIYGRISGLLSYTVAIVLLLTALCVMAAMTNVAMERKMDVGLMKAIGGATRRVIRLFLAEAALLGLAGGLLGAAAGIFLSMGLGKAVFGVAARPRLIVYPVAVALTMLVAVLSAFPLRRLASLRPASVFRGEA